MNIRNLILGLLLITLWACSSPKKTLIGVWKVTKIDGVTPLGVDETLKLTFQKDGVLKAGTEDSGEDIVQWRLSDDHKEIYLKTSFSDEEEVLKVISIEKNKIVLDNHNSVAEFVRAGKAAPAAKPVKGVAKKIVGTWKLIRVNDIEVPNDESAKMLIDIRADGSVETAGAASGDSGKWHLSKDNKMLILNFGEKEEPAMFELSKNTDTLTITDEKGARIIFVRTTESLGAIEEKTFEETIPETTNKEPLVAKKIEAAQLNGSWQVAKIDEIPVEASVPSLVLVLKKEGNFEIIEGGTIARKGSWTFEANNAGLKISDNNGYADRWTVKSLDKGVLIMSDYYSSYEFVKIDK